MLDLRKDLFIHLSISAKALKENPKLVKYNLSEFESNSENFRYSFIKKNNSKNIEETIDEVIKNPKLIELKKELEAAENIFEILKQKETNSELIYRINQKILKLKKLISEKSYF